MWTLTLGHRKNPFYPRGVVDSLEKISVLNEYFNVGKEYSGGYVWATIETLKQTQKFDL
jgi:hypothetical protein